MQKLWVTVSIIVFAASVVLGTYLQSRPGLQFAVPSPAEIAQLDWVTVVLQGMALLVGIFFGHLHRTLSELRAKSVNTVDMLAVLAGLGRSTGFWTALTAAPLIFGIVIVLTGPIPLGTALFLAFQNGFFWERVIPQGPVDVSGKPAGQ